MEKVYMEESSGIEWWNNRWTVVDLEKEAKAIEHDINYELYDKYLPKKGKILEGGCGLGRLQLYYMKRGYDFVGLDYSGAAIKEIHKNQPDNVVLVGDVLDLPFPERYFTAYISIGVFSWLCDRFADGLKEAYRVLDSNGLLFMAVPQICLGSRLQFSHKLRVNPLVRRVMGKKPLVLSAYRHTRKEIDSYLGEAGFEIIGTSVTYPEEGFWNYVSCFRSKSSARYAKQNPRGWENLKRQDPSKAYELNRIGRKMYSFLIKRNPYLFSVGYFVIARKMALSQNTVGN